MSGLIFKITILFLRLTANPAFIIKIEKGIVTKVSGTVKNSFLTDCIDIIEQGGIQQGIIYTGQGKFGSTVLKASGNIPDDVLQALRNSWGLAQ